MENRGNFGSCSCGENLRRKKCRAWHGSEVRGTTFSIIKENSSWSVAPQETEHLTKYIHPRPLTCEDCAAVRQGVYSWLKKYKRRNQEIFESRTEKLSQRVKMIFDKKKRKAEDPGPGRSVELISQDSFLDRNLQTKQIENVKVDENYHEDYENESFDDKNELAVEKETDLKAMKAKVVNDKITNVKADKNVHAEDNDVEKIKDEKDVFDTESEAAEQGGHNCKNESKVPSGTVKEVEVDKRMDASTVVSFLLIIFAIVYLYGKTLHKQSLFIARLSQLSQPSLLSQLQPVELLSFTSSCSCQAESEVCCKVTTGLTAKVSSMASKVSTCVTWCRQIWVAVYAVTERLTVSNTTAMLDMVIRVESVACAVIAWLKQPLQSW